MPVKNNREYRNMILSCLETRDKDADQDEKMVVRGYASTFNEPYTLFESDRFRLDEVVDSRAFENADMSDVIMQYDHEGRVFARMSNNTLTVTPDERGLLIEADLSGTEGGRQLYNDIRGGYINKMSFGFTVAEEDWLETKTEDKSKDLSVRTIKAIRKLYDVSAVSIPANDATEISVRNLTDGVIERVQAERLEAEKLELRRRKMMMKLKAR